MKTNPDLIIHGGWNKTGTTFLQKNILPMITPRLVSGPYLKFSDLQRVKESPSPLVISDESLLGTTILSRHRSRATQRMNFLSAWSEVAPHTRFVICIRRHAGIIESLYKQYIHMGGTLKPNQFFSIDNSNCFLNPSDLLYSPTLDYIHQNFQGPHFIYDYSSFTKDALSLCTQIAEFINPQLDIHDFSAKAAPVLSEHHDNRSVTFYRAHVLRFINRIVSSTIGPGRIPLRLVRPLLGGKTPRQIFQNSSKTGNVTRRFFENQEELDEYYREDWANCLKYLTPIT